MFYMTELTIILNYTVELIKNVFRYESYNTTNKIYFLIDYLPLFRLYQLRFIIKYNQNSKHNSKIFMSKQINNFHVA